MNYDFLKTEVEVSGCFADKVFNDFVQEIADAENIVPKYSSTSLLNIPLARTTVGGYFDTVDELLNPIKKKILLGLMWYLTLCVVLTLSFVFYTINMLVAYPLIYFVLFYLIYAQVDQLRIFNNFKGYLIKQRYLDALCDVVDNRDRELSDANLSELNELKEKYKTALDANSELLGYLEKNHDNETAFKILAEEKTHKEEVIDSLMYMYQDLVNRSDDKELEEHIDHCNNANLKHVERNRTVIHTCRTIQ